MPILRCGVRLGDDDAWVVRVNVCDVSEALLRRHGEIVRLLRGVARGGVWWCVVKKHGKE
jgi:hypothetical protein